jgi:putative transposase
MLYFAIMPKPVKGWGIFGRPQIIQCDNGRDYTSKAMLITLAILGIFLDLDYPYYPNSKGKVERVFRTLDTMLLRLLPGHFEDIGRSETSACKRVGELLTREQLKAELERAVVEYNNTVHGETERKPQELWEETVAGPDLPEEDELNTCLLHYDKERTIQGFGIRIKLGGEKRLYWHEAFTYYWKEKVTVAYNPESLDSVLLYDSSGKFLLEAWDLRAENPKYTLADVRTSRKKILGMLRGIKKRGKDYMEEVWGEDRRVEQRKNYEEIREKIKNNELPKLPEKTSKENEMDAIRKLFRRQDTGE